MRTVINLDKGLWWKSMAEIKCDAVLTTIANFNGNKTAATQALKIGRSTLHRIIGESNGDPKED